VGGVEGGIRVHIDERVWGRRSALQLGGDEKDWDLLEARRFSEDTGGGDEYLFIE